MSKRALYINAFAALGERLAEFGRDADSPDIIRRATEENPWFSPDDIITAVSSLRECMLQRDTLERWLAPYALPYGAGKEIAVVMAGNIPLAGFFDMMCAVITGNRCHAKFSSKDRAFMEYAAGQVNDILGRSAVVTFDDRGSYDAVIASGSDNSNRYFRTRFGDIPALLRGSRYSAAVLDGTETDAELAALSKDIFLYNGLGCRSVSLVFVPEEYDIEVFGKKAAPASVNPKYRNNYLQTRAMLALRGEEYADCGCFLLKEETAFPTAPSVVNYSRYKSPADIAEWLSDNEGAIQCVVSRGGEYLRGTAFGRAQYPWPWDYPDGVDVVGFLNEMM